MGLVIVIRWQQYFWPYEIWWGLMLCFLNWGAKPIFLSVEWLNDPAEPYSTQCETEFHNDMQHNVSPAISLSIFGLLINGKSKS